MSDQVEETPQEGVGPFKESSDNDVEVIIDDGTVTEEAVPDEYKGLSKSQIIDRLKEVEKKVSEKDTQAGIYERLGTAIEKMGERPTPVPPAVASPPAPTDEELAKQKESFNEKFVSDPAAASEEFYTKKIGPMVAQTLSGNLSLARRVMELDPERGATFKKYASEIDQMVNTAPVQAKINPGIYEQAYKQVISNHIDEIIAEKVTAAVAKATETTKTASAGKPAPFSEGRGAPMRPGRPTVTMKKEEADRLRILGIDPVEYGASVLGRKE